MAEYIERGDFEFPYMTMTLWGLNHETCHAYNEGVKAAADYIASIPAADVVEVVRCKDCKHFNMREMECQNDAVSTDNEGGASYSLNFYLDDFCSYGERKEG